MYELGHSVWLSQGIQQATGKTEDKDLALMEHKKVKTNQPVRTRAAPHYDKPSAGYKEGSVIRG